MNVQQTTETLQKLRLEGMAHAYQSVLQTPVQHQPAAHELIAQLAQAEAQHRHQRKSQLYLTLSKLRFDATLPEIQCSPERNLSKDQIALLMDCSFIRNPQNILITGATGCGKSYLACALGRQACQFGFKTLYLNINRFIEKIESAKLDGSYIKLLNQIEKTPLVVLDDFGLQPISNNVRLALLQILEDRYAKRPVIITSQLPVAAWHEYIGEPTLADAILDRITSNAHRIELKGESLRKLKH
jgi:DNA replication protein DnaC